MSDLNEEILNDDEDFGDLEDADEDALLRDDEEPIEERDVLDIADEGLGDNQEDSTLSNLEPEEDEKSERKDKFTTERKPITAPESYSESNNSYQKRRPFQRNTHNAQRYNNFNRNNNHYHQKQRLPVPKYRNQIGNHDSFNRVLNMLNQPSNAGYQKSNRPYRQQQVYESNIEVFNQNFPAPSTSQSKTVLINPHFQGVVTVDNNNSWSNQGLQPVAQPQMISQPQHQMPPNNYQAPLNQWGHSMPPPAQPYGPQGGPGAMQGPPMGQGPMGHPFQPGMPSNMFQGQQSGQQFGGPMGQPFQAGMQPAMFQGPPPGHQMPFQNGPPVQNTYWNGPQNPMYPNQQFPQQGQVPPNQPPNRMIFMQPLPPGPSNQQINNFPPPNHQFNHNNNNNNFIPPQNNNRVLNSNQNEQFNRNQQHKFNNIQRFNQKRKVGGGNPNFQNKKMLKNVPQSKEITQVEMTPEVKIGHRPAVINKVEDEDPETQDLRLKIEEQRRQREELLKQKEENRRKKLLSSNEAVNVKNLTPIQTNQQKIVKKKLLTPKSNIVEIKTGNRNNICLTNGRKITRFQRQSQANLNTNATIVVKLEPDQNDIDPKHLSSFLADRTILTKDVSLMDTRAVFIKNLASSTPDKKIMTICKNIGNVQKLHRDKNERHATVVFKSVASAHAFFKKYQRHMLDLSMIEVTLKPMAEIEHLM